ncbi:MAG: TonB-dependent receptor [Aquabacterium sp.]|uniref:TonB-dependent receptor n=1 Tax=Aquabacterium sp. TaxID=1872578 RepID=UPI003BCCA9B7
MFSLNTVRVAPGVRSALAVACGLALSVAQTVQAAGSEEALGPVVVTASRMNDLLQTAAIGATIITAEQMQRAGVADANEAIRKLGGVAARSDLYNGRDPSLDLRGYGEAASSNVVLLIDGIRISENENYAARVSSIPLSQIDRIEIVRGGASVMWGEGASAGAINIILKHGTRNERSAKLSASVASNRGHEVQADGAWGEGNWNVDASVRRVRTDGYRDNSGYKQDSGSIGAQWQQGGWRAGFRILQEDQNSRLPGSLSPAQYKANPRQTNTPEDDASNHETRYLGNVSYQQGAWTAQMDVGQRQRDSDYQYVSYGSPRVYSHSEQGQISPRLAYAQQHGDVGIKAVAGLDWQGWDFDKTGTAGPEIGRQDNKAVFTHADFSLPTQTRVSVGWREERVNKKDAYPGDPGWFLPALNYSRDDKLHAGELGINQTLRKGLDAYVRSATSYRLANIDENRSTPASAALRPQRNYDRELGVKWAQNGHGLTARYFVQETDDEIAFDNILYANTNIDPTRRRGLELEGRVSLTRDVVLSATWQQLTARYREGANAGKDMVLVAPHTATARAAWRVDDHQTLDVGVQYLSRMRWGGDEANLCTERTPSSLLWDARYAWSDKLWTLALSGVNLTDRQGYNYAYSCGQSWASVYPYSGRAVKFTASRQF